MFSLRYLLPPLLAILFSHPVWAEKPLAPESIAGTTRVSAEQLIDLVMERPQLRIIDVRKQAEFDKGHIEGAINLLNTEMTEQRLTQLVQDKDAPLLFYCNGERCMRSSHACNQALSWGYTQIYWFRGGWSEWEEKGLPVSRK